MIRKWCIIILVIGITSASTSHVGRCKDALNGSPEGTFGSGLIKDVRISGCPDAPCQLKKGTEATIEFDFSPDKKYEKLVTAVFGGIGIIRVPFRDVNGMDACKDIIRKSDGRKGCPLEPKETYTYSNSFPILRNYPSVSVLVQYGLNDNNKNPVVCFTLPAKIVN